MKACTRGSLQSVLTALTALCVCPLSGELLAQTFTTLHSFSPLYGTSEHASNWDGASPNVLILSGGTIFGTTFHGGDSGHGTVFKVGIDGMQFVTLHSFTADAPYPINLDGANPRAGLLLAGNLLYGTAANNGTRGQGTVYQVGTDGTGFTTLHSFAGNTRWPYTNNSGAAPWAGLILSGNTLYGTTYSGGLGNLGAVFKVNAETGQYATLHSFGSVDGLYPQAGLTLSGNTLYGTAMGGNREKGTVFKLDTDGSGFTILHHFTAVSTNLEGVLTNADGWAPNACLTLSDNVLYGTTLVGGLLGSGTVFKLHTNGTGFTTLHSFAGTGGSASTGRTLSGLCLSGGNLYGTTFLGGDSGSGSVFKLNTDGTGFTNLYSFTVVSPPVYGTNSDGANPVGLVLSGNTLYGTTGKGGDWGNGTIFSLSFEPKLSIVLSGAAVILSWPTNCAGFDYSGYTLQAITNLASSVWVTVHPDPVVVNGYFTVTKPITDGQQFFRLRQ